MVIAWQPLICFTLRPEAKKCMTENLARLSKAPSLCRVLLGLFLVGGQLVIGFGFIIDWIFFFVQNVILTTPCVPWAGNVLLAVPCYIQQFKSPLLRYLGNNNKAWEVCSSWCRTELCRFGQAFQRPICILLSPITQALFISVRENKTHLISVCLSPLLLPADLHMNLMSLTQKDWGRVILPHFYQTVLHNRKMYWLHLEWISAR